MTTHLKQLAAETADKLEQTYFDIEYDSFTSLAMIEFKAIIESALQQAVKEERERLGPWLFHQGHDCLPDECTCGLDAALKGKQ